MTDQPASSPDRTADLERRIAELERASRGPWQAGRSGIEEAFWALMHTMFPEEARKHLKSAGREQLLAARVYLDRWIAGLDEEDGSRAGAERNQPHEKIEIE
jgi:hypothetical protein